VASAETLSLDAATARIQPVDTLALPLGPGQPQSFLHALGKRDDFEDLVVFTALLTGFFEFFTRDGVALRSGFFGPVERALQAQGRDVQFVPADFRRFRPIAEQGRPRVMATSVAMPDSKGMCSLSLHAGATVEELHRCGADPDRLLIAEMNEKLPRTYGQPPDHPHALHLDEIDILVEGEHDPVALADPDPSDVDRAIADHVRAFIPTGATLQTGIGAVPNMVATLLAEGDGGDYGIHSEMFTNGLMRLHQAGKVTNCKGVYDMVSVSTFAFGSQELYDWLHENRDVRFLPVHLVNEPSIIARNFRMISINAALAVDAAGQVAADTLGGRQFSGIGGHEDFVEAAGEELEDRSLICFPSTANVKGEMVSRIVAQLPPGTLVTTPRHQVDVVVTEYGAAELFGRTVGERREALANIAHPDFRDEVRNAQVPGA
jgi:acyl-CoA hydrolase